MSALALIGYLMILVLMITIITKKMSAFSALILIPLVFGIIACIHNGESPFALGGYIGDGIANIVGTFTTVLFAITYFGLMFAAGLFDPIVDKVVKVVHGDPASGFGGHGNYGHAGGSGWGWKHHLYHLCHSSGPHL